MAKWLVAAVVGVLAPPLVLLVPGLWRKVSLVHTGRNAGTPARTDAVNSPRVVVSEGTPHDLRKCVHLERVAS